MLSLLSNMREVTVKQKKETKEGNESTRQLTA